jgi:hypothetical protein
MYPLVIAANKLAAEERQQLLDISMSKEIYARSLFFYASEFEKFGLSRGAAEKRSQAQRLMSESRIDREKAAHPLLSWCRRRFQWK